jgi:hypothetical protein
MRRLGFMRAGELVGMRRGSRGVRIWSLSHFRLQTRSSADIPDVRSFSRNVRPEIDIGFTPDAAFSSDAMMTLDLGTRE